MDFRSTLTGLAQSLDEQGARWALIGGVAMALHGVARTTFDVDLLIESEDLPSLDRALTELGCRLRHRWEESSHYLAEDGRSCPVDALHAHRPHSRAMLQRALRIPLQPGGPALPVVQLEDLIGLKVQALVNDHDREQQELVDTRALLEAAVGAGRSVDLGRIREYFDLFGRGPQLERILKGLEHALS